MRKLSSLEATRFRKAFVYFRPVSPPGRESLERLHHMNTQIDLGPLITIILAVSAAALLLSLLLIGWLLWRIKRINLPPGADMLDALRAAPLSVVIVLDLLDLALDIFSAPITWVLLTRLGLAPLRWVAVIKDLIPFSAWLPLMTLAWIGVRLLDRSRFAPSRTVYRIERRP